MIDKRILQGNGILTIFLSIILYLPLFAQEKDAGLWMSIDVEKKLTPALSACFTEEVRMYENITEVGGILTDFGVKYRFNNRLKAGVTYRFSKKKLVDDTYRNFNSWYAEVFYNEKLKPVQLTLRLRYQSRYTEPNTSDNTRVNQDHTRIKLNVKYDLDRKYSPYIYVESFFNFANPVYYPLDQMRYCTGVEYTFNRMHAVDLHYMIAKEYNVRHPQTDFIIGIGYSLTF